jgi:single-stranded-DNA-specific exonuclease
MLHKKWIIADADKEKASILSEKLNIDPFIAFLLVSRGIDDELAAADFFSDSCRLTSPFSLTDMDRAVDRINRAVENGEHICIFGDYDCDGITATALLYTFFESMGAYTEYFIPNRVTDGYGMNKEAIDRIKALGTDLIVTVDNGISSFEEADYIYSLGMELIITDHHQLADKLPRAEAVVNPHRQEDTLGFCDWSGVGVAFKLACAVYDGDDIDMLEQFADLVALGTIGDVVPLVDENRILVKEGIKLINSDSRPGIAALKAEAGSTDSIGAGEIAFQLCPRINAAGRMDTADKALELLLCEDYEDAKFKAAQLNTENTHRHEVERNIFTDIQEKIKADPSLADESVIVIAGEGYHNGVIGIVAAHIAESYGKPAIVFGIDEDGEATGSARSIEGFNIFEAIDSCSDMLSHYGGHPLAAGAGLDADRIDEFRARINAFANERYPVMPPPVMRIDCKLSPYYLTTQLVDSLGALEPYGAENPQPVFGLYNVTLKSVTPIGEGKHIRIEAEKKGRTFKAAKFRTTIDEFPYKPGDRLDLAVRLSKNMFKGKYYLSIQAVDIRKNGIDDDRYFAEKNGLEHYRLGRKTDEKLYPDRETCSVIYRFLRSAGGWKYSFDDLYFALQEHVTYGQLYFALAAFEEAGLINRDNGIILNKTQGRASLEDTQALRDLKGRTDFE